MVKKKTLFVLPFLAIGLTACEEYPLVTYEDNIRTKQTIQRQSETAGKYVSTEEIKRVNPHYETHHANLFFEPGEFELTRDHEENLDKVINAIEAMNGNYDITIIGHSDDEGLEESKERVSTRRAYSAYDYLMNKSIKVSNVSLDGVSDRNPSVLGDSDYSDMKNRRVEVTATYKE